MELVEVNNIKFYKLPKGFVLYRGNTDQYLYDFKLNHIKEYFALDVRVANIHGLATEYVVTKELLLYCMDDFDNVKKLYDSAPQHIKNKITKVFGYNPLKGIKDLIRISDETDDKAILDYMCSLNMNGYGCNEMVSDESSRKFHAEVAICNPLSNVKLSKKVEYSKDKIEKERLNSEEKKQKKILEEARTRSRLMKQRRFMDDDDDDVSDVRSHFSPKRISFNL